MAGRTLRLVAAVTGLLASVAGGLSLAGPPEASAVGRWDLTVQGSDGAYPSWLEVRRSGRTTLVGSFVGRTGSARPISRVDFDKGRLHFSVPPQWEERKDDLTFEGTVEGDAIKGYTTDDKGRRVAWTGRRAPALKRERPPKWGEPTELFNGKDLTGWKRRRGGKGGWVVKDGLLVNATPGDDLLTEKAFTDFRLHAEYRYPRGSNSGIYLRGRYEVQIEDDFGRDADSHGSGGVYGFLTPSVNAAKRPGEWQAVDITLLGRAVTVVLNGERVIDRQAIPGITGGALDSDEGAAGPVLLQGDHVPIEFRKVTLTPAE